MSMLLNLLVCLSIGGAGTATGWFIRRFAERKTTKRTQSENQATGFEALDFKKQDVESLMSKLRETCDDIAFDVETHNESVQEASAQLKKQEPDASEGVLKILKSMLQANAKLQSQLEVAEDKLFDQARQIQSHVMEANTDALTLVSNRRAFDQEIAMAQELYATDGKPVSVMMVDVDYFKKFNDNYGHHAGDEVLKSVARTLRRKVKRNGHVCRYGGEEFAVIFHGQTTDACMEWAEQARAELARTQIHYEGEVLTITASGGLAEINESDGAEGMVRRADDALYEAKEAGRNCGFWNDGTHNHLIPALEGDGVCESRVNLDQPLWASELTDASTFCDELGRRLSEWKRGGSGLALGVLKVDNWIDLFTTHGEPTADLVLQATSQFLKASVRDMDNVAILGEGQFAMLFPSARLENTSKIGERLRSAISRCEVPGENGKVNFTVSGGIAEAKGDDSEGEFLARAQEAMALAGSLGGNLCYAHDGEKSLRVTIQNTPVPERNKA
jgi:diguanylate cyclase